MSWPGWGDLCICDAVTGDRMVSGARPDSDVYSWNHLDRRLGKSDFLNCAEEACTEGRRVNVGRKYHDSRWSPGVHIRAHGQLPEHSVSQCPTVLLSGPKVQEVSQLNQ